MNKRVAFDDVVDEFIDGDPGHRINMIQMATTTPARLPVGSYVNPAAVSMGQLLSWLDGASLNARAYAATPNAARQLDRAGLLANRMTNKRVKLEVDAPPREGDATDVPTMNVIANAILRQRRHVTDQTRVRLANLATEVAAPPHAPELEWYDEDDEDDDI